MLTDSHFLLTKTNYSFLSLQTRKLTFQLVVAYNLNFPSSWGANEMAGPDWLTAFLKRHPSLSIRSPQATSLSRATSFNQKNVESFFNNLEDVVERFAFTAKNIWNADETGITTVQNPCRVLARRGSKQVGALTSRERGQLVTMMNAINALGN